MISVERAQQKRNVHTTFDIVHDEMLLRMIALHVGPRVFNSVVRAGVQRFVKHLVFVYFLTVVQLLYEQEDVFTFRRVMTVSR